LFHHFKALQKSQRLTFSEKETQKKKGKNVQCTDTWQETKIDTTENIAL